MFGIQGVKLEPTAKKKQEEHARLALLDYV